LWLVPPKDLVSTAVWIGAWTGREVDWSGQRLRVERDGRMLPLTLPGGAPARVATEGPEPLQAAEH
jgi:hypothetical protein